MMHVGKDLSNISNIISHLKGKFDWGRGKSASKMAHSHGYQKDASFPYNMGLSIGLLKCL